MTERKKFTSALYLFQLPTLTAPALRGSPLEDFSCKSNPRAMHLLSEVHETAKYISELVDKGEAADANFMQISETCHTKG